MNSDRRGHVYAIGGLELQLWQTSARVDRYDIATNQWIPMPELNQGRCDARACLNGDSIYVVGGAREVN